MPKSKKNEKSKKFDAKFSSKMVSKVCTKMLVECYIPRKKVFCLFQLFSTKNGESEDFDKRLECCTLQTLVKIYNRYYLQMYIKKERMLTVPVLVYLVFSVEKKIVKESQVSTSQSR